MRYIIILLMGLTFLNVSFLQVEINLLKSVTGNTITLSILAELCEEQRGTGETEDDQNDKESKFVHPSVEQYYHNISYSQDIKWLVLEAALHRGYLKKFSPPPEV
jgi:hypothetical protein